MKVLNKTVTMRHCHRRRMSMRGPKTGLIGLLRIAGIHCPALHYIIIQETLFNLFIYLFHL